MLRGLATISFWADDLKAARTGYTELLGIEPYFERPDSENPAYIEFRLGDYQHELGIIDSRYAPHGAAAGLGGVVAYWSRGRCGGIAETAHDNGSKRIRTAHAAG